MAAGGPISIAGGPDGRAESIVKGRAMSERLRFQVSGMDCAACAQTIETAVRRLDGVSDIRVNTMTEVMTLTARREMAGRIATTVGALGYGAALIEKGAAAPATARGHGHDHEHDHDHGHDHAHRQGMEPAKAAGGPRHDDHGAPIDGKWWASQKGRIVIGTGILNAFAFAAGAAWPQASFWIFVAAALIAAVPVARKAIQAARHSSLFTIEMLMTIAVIGALLIGAAGEAAIVVFLFACGELLESVAAARARAGIRALAEIAPKTALVETASGTVETPVEGVAVGAVVLVRPGDRVPADGKVLSGTSAIDEAALTGESVPRSKGPGDDVYAGSINREAALRIRADKPAADTLIARVVRLVEEATEAKAPTERFIDRFSRFYMPAITGLALAVVLVPPLAFGEPWGTWIYRGLTLLLIGCPCALVISTPAAIAAALAAGARRGLLVKGGNVLEAIGKVKAIAFDKTGTLTEGRPAVTEIVPLGGLDADAVLRLAAAVEAASSHPLATAITEHARARGIAFAAAADGAALPGKGVTGTVDGRRVAVGAPGRLGLDAATVARGAGLESEGNSVAAVIVDGVPAGLIGLRDAPRPDAREALALIRRLGIEPVMLTGDNKAAGEAIGRMLGIEARSEMLPEDKLAAVKGLSKNGGVAKVGDGINDAPALAAATVGIAMGSGTELALEAGDAALLRNRIADVPALIALSRRTMRIVRENVAIALGLKAVFLATTLFGLTGLWIAVLADTGATVIVTANALRLLREGRDRGAPTG
jgi:Cd2+/Zn2+-exporting ATPase